MVSSARPKKQAIVISQNVQRAIEAESQEK